MGAAKPSTDTMRLSTPSGKPVSVRLGEYIGKVSLRVWVAGYEGSANDCHLRTAGTLTVYASTTVTVQLDPPSIASLVAAIEERQRVLNDRAENRVRRLREQRERLRLEYLGAVEEADLRRERAWESGDERGTFEGAAEDAARDRVAAKAAALAEFDAAHPEVAASLKREREAAVKKALWS